MAIRQGLLDNTILVDQDTHLHTVELQLKWARNDPLGVEVSLESIQRVNGLYEIGTTAVLQVRTECSSLVGMDMLQTHCVPMDDQGVWMLGRMGFPSRVKRYLTQVSAIMKMLAFVVA